MLETYTTIAKAIADPNRVRILKLLETGELCVCQITTVLDLATCTISKQLSELKKGGLVQHRRDGKWIYYRLAERELNRYAQYFLGLVACLLNDDPTILEDRRLLALVNTVPVTVLCHQGRAALGPNAQASKSNPCCESSP
jgi:DNA-binding transcriptional ArsR family regulator